MRINTRVFLAALSVGLPFSASAAQQQAASGSGELAPAQAIEQSTAPNPSRGAAQQPDGSRGRLSPEDRRAKWEQMSPDEQAALREKMQQHGGSRQRLSPEERRAKWEQMSPEDRENAKKTFRQRFDALSPEQQAQIKARRASQSR